MILKIMMVALAGGAALSANPDTQSIPPNSQATIPTATATVVQGADDHIPTKTVVQIMITDVISSKTNVIGDSFGLKLAAPLIIDGRTILPAGLIGRGEVTHAAKSGGGGKAGELIVNARYLECGDLRIPLGHFHYQVVGANNIGGAYAASVIPFGQFMVSSHDAVIPAGTSGTAQVNTDVTITQGAIGRCAPA